MYLYHKFKQYIIAYSVSFKSIFGFSFGHKHLSTNNDKTTINKKNNTKCI